MTLGEYFKTIADSIRTKTGGTVAIKASDFAPTIRGFLNFSDVKSVSGEGYASTNYYDPREQMQYSLAAECKIEGIQNKSRNTLKLYVKCSVSGSDNGQIKTQTLTINLV